MTAIGVGKTAPAAPGLYKRTGSDLLTVRWTFTCPVGSWGFLNQVTLIHALTFEEKKSVTQGTISKVLCGRSLVYLDNTKPPLSTVYACVGHCCFISPSMGNGRCRTQRRQTLGQVPMNDIDHLWQAFKQTRAKPGAALQTPLTFIDSLSGGL